MAKKPLELQSLKWPFVGLAVLLALSSAWAVYDEVFARRPWKVYQREFFALEGSHFKADLARQEKRLSDPAMKQQYEAAKAELLAATNAITGNAEQRKAFDQAAKAEEDAKVKMDEGKLYLGFAKSEMDAAYYKTREARHEGHKEEEEKLQKEMDTWAKETAARDEVYQAAIKRHEEASKARIAFQARKEAAALALAKFDKPSADLKEKIEASSHKWPAMEQYWIAPLKNSWGSETVDRCQNCHMGVNKGGYSAPWEVLDAKKKKLPAADFKTQYGIDDEVTDQYQAAYDKLCERVPEEPAQVPIGGFKLSPEPAPITARFAGDKEQCLSRKDYEKWLDLAEAYCGRTGRWLPKTKSYFIDNGGKIATGEAAEQAQWACTDKDSAKQFNDVLNNNPYDVKPVFRTHPHRFDLLVKTHTPETFGCTTCHGGEGAQTKGVEHFKFAHGKDDHDWNDPLTDMVTVMGKHYKGAFLQSKCDKCHVQDVNLEHAPLLSKGKKLFIDVGCWGCHPAEGYTDLPKRGPTLVTIASKTNPGWLKTWIQYPKAWRPGTRMPNFWPGAVDPKAVAHGIDAASKPRPEGMSDEEVLANHRGVREEEVSAITAYLWTNSQPAKMLENKGAGDAKKGQALVESVGCMACHVFAKGDQSRRSEASKERDYAPNLSNIGDKANPEWIYSWVKNPKAMWPQTKMPDLRLTDAEASDVTAYLVTLKTDQKYPAPPELAPGSDKARLTQMAAKGQELIAKYGCFGCHDIKGFENAQKIGTELSEHGRKDPNLLDFGDVKYFTQDPKRRETYANWVWTKLGTPRIYAYERVETRMPQWDFSDDEKLSLLTFLKGLTGEKPPREYLSGVEGNKASVLQGEKLVFWNGCRNCHIVEKRGGTIRDRFNEDDQSYAPPMLTGEGWKTQPQWLFAFLKNPVGPATDSKKLRPWLNVRMPTFHFTDEDATGLVRYFDAASNKPFPYLTTTEGPQPSRERLSEANALFTELKCLSCHVVGELRPGQDPGSAAPNLLLAKHRLRPDWIPAWLQNPQALMDGTRMPSFWDFSDPKHPSAPSKLFNSNGDDQVDALRDLIMHLGDEGEQPGPKRAENPAPKRTRGG